MKRALRSASVILALALASSCARGRLASADPGVELTKYPDNFTCFKIRTQTGYTVITDPYGMYGTMEPNLVTVSHAHSDHCDLSKLRGRYRILCQPGSYVEGGYAIEAIPGHHNKGERSTSNLIFVFDIDGLRIAQFGSQGDFPTRETLDRVERADVLIIQVFEARQPKLSYEEVFRIANALGAKIIIPAHGDYGMTAKLASLFGKKRAERVKSGVMTLRKDEIRALKKPKVVVLDN